MHLLSWGIGTTSKIMQHDLAGYVIATTIRKNHMPRELDNLSRPVRHVSRCNGMICSCFVGCVYVLREICRRLGGEVGPKELTEW